jgi:hypothetical protein
MHFVSPVGYCDLSRCRNQTNLKAALIRFYPDWCAKLEAREMPAQVLFAGASRFAPKPNGGAQR